MLAQNRGIDNETEPAMTDLHATSSLKEPAATSSQAPARPQQRCVIVVDAALPAGLSANAAAVLALTFGQRHPSLVGEPLVDASGIAHPGLIPIGIAVLAANAKQLAAARAETSAAAACDVVGFPVQGQQTTDYAAFNRDVGQRAAERAVRAPGAGIRAASCPSRG